MDKHGNSLENCLKFVCIYKTMFYIFDQITTNASKITHKKKTCQASANGPLSNIRYNFSVTKSFGLILLSFLFKI